MKRDHGEAAYSRAGLISDSPENVFKRCDRGGGKSFRVPRRRRLRPRARPSHLPQVPRRARSARLPSQNTSSVSKRSAGRRGQRAARAARLAPDLGCAARRRRTHGRMDGRTDRQTRGKVGMRARGEARYLARSTARGINGRSPPPPTPPRRGRAVGTARLSRPSRATAPGGQTPGSPTAAALLLFTAGVCSGAGNRRLPAPPPIPAPPRAPSGRRGAARPAPSRSRSNFCRAPLSRPRPAATPARLPPHLQAARRGLGALQRAALRSRRRGRARAVGAAPGAAAGGARARRGGARCLRRAERRWRLGSRPPIPA